MPIDPLVKLPVFDDKGFQIHTHGVSGYLGLYFVGMAWMPSLKTGILMGVNEAALHVAESIVRAVQIPGAAHTRLGIPHA